MDDFSRSKWYNTLMILLGLVFIVLGTVMLAGNRQIYNFTGRLDFIEDHFRAGTPAALKLFAVVMVLVGLFMATGLGHWLTDPIANGLGRIFPTKQ